MVRISILIICLVSNLGGIGFKRQILEIFPAVSRGFDALGTEHRQRIMLRYATLLFTTGERTKALRMYERLVFEQFKEQLLRNFLSRLSSVDEAGTFLLPSFEERIHRLDDSWSRNDLFLKIVELYHQRGHPGQAYKVLVEYLNEANRLEAVDDAYQLADCYTYLMKSAYRGGLEREFSAWHQKAVRLVRRNKLSDADRFALMIRFADELYSMGAQAEGTSFLVFARLLAGKSSHIPLEMLTDAAEVALKAKDPETARLFLQTAMNQCFGCSDCDYCHHLLHGYLMTGHFTGEGGLLRFLADWIKLQVTRTEDACMTQELNRALFILLVRRGQFAKARRILDTLKDDRDADYNRWLSFWGVEWLMKCETSGPLHLIDEMDDSYWALDYLLNAGRVLYVRKDFANSGKMIEEGLRTLNGCVQENPPFMRNYCYEFAVLFRSMNYVDGLITIRNMLGEQDRSLLRDFVSLQIVRILSVEGDLRSCAEEIGQIQAPEYLIAAHAYIGEYYAANGMKREVRRTLSIILQLLIAHSPDIMNDVLFDLLYSFYGLNNDQYY